MTEGKKLLVADASACQGCLACVVACAQQHAGMSAPSRARIQLDLDPFGGNNRLYYCMQCTSAPCAEVCPVGAIHFLSKEAYWTIDYDQCIGCKQCVSACPLGVMFYDVIGDQVIKCETCHGDPICARVCPTGALVWDDPAGRRKCRKGG